MRLHASFVMHCAPAVISRIKPFSLPAYHLTWRRKHPPGAIAAAALRNDRMELKPSSAVWIITS